MTYPKTIINRTVRRVFFFLLVAIFCVSAPILILYSIGYRIDWKTRSITETGVISVDAQPRDASVYLSGLKINKKLPLRLTNRMPGTYTLKIEKVGYKTWEKNVEVKSKQTTYIKDISLLKDLLPVPLFEKNNRNITSIHPAANGNFLIMASEKNNSIILELLNLQTNEIFQISRLPSNIYYNIDLSPFDNSILITTNTTDGKAQNIILLSANNPDNLKTYTLQKDDYPNHFQWQKESLYPAVFTREGENLIRITLNGYEKIHSVKPTDIWYVDTLEKLWLNENGVVYLVSSDEEKDKISISGLTENIKRIIDINAYRIILQSDRNIVVISRDNNKTETINATFLTNNPATKEWIIWSHWELWSVYENGNIALLNRTSDNMASVFPLDNVGVLIVVNKDGISSFNPGYYVSQNIFKGEVKTACVNQKTKTIYFLGKIGDNENLFSLEY